MRHDWIRSMKSAGMKNKMQVFSHSKRWVQRGDQEEGGGSAGGPAATSTNCSGSSGSSRSMSRHCTHLCINSKKSILLFINISWWTTLLPKYCKWNWVHIGRQAVTKFDDLHLHFFLEICFRLLVKKESCVFLRLSRASYLLHGSQYTLYPIGFSFEKTQN